MKLFGKVALFCVLLLSIFASPVEAGPVTGALGVGIVTGISATWAWFKGPTVPTEVAVAVLGTSTLSNISSPAGGGVKGRKNSRVCRCCS